MFLKNEKRIKWWGGLISQNDFADDELISFMSDCKCEILFTGLESMDELFLEANSKKQNLHNVSSIIDCIDRAQRKHILVNFGYLFDPRISSISQMKEQFRKVTENEKLLFPCFFSFVSPLLGTTVFKESVERGELLPGLRLRDLDGCTLAYRNVRDSMDDISEFADVIFRNLKSIVSLRRLLFKTLRFMWRYRVKWMVKWYVIYKNNTRPFTMYRTTKDYRPRSYIGGTDRLDPQYDSYPEDISDGDYERYFAPVMVTDADGEPADWLRQYIYAETEEA